MGDAISINLKRLRKMRDLTQQEIAEKAGISRNAYRSIETGDSTPRGKTLSSLARALGVSVFKLTEDPPVLHSLRFRTSSTLSSQQRAERELIETDVALWLKNFNELEEMLDNRKPYIFENHDLASFDPKTAASEARNILDIENDQCIADICELLDYAGIKLIFLDSHLASFFGLSVGPMDGGPAIGVNTNESIPIERQIFTAAHELGHLLLHSQSYGSNQISENKQQENEASLFASHFLMPEIRFEEIWSENRGLNWVQSVLHIKRLFRVSYKTVLHRLVEEGYVDDTVHKDFYNSYNRLFDKKLKFKEEPHPYQSIGKEPANLHNVDFVANQLNRSVRDALEKKRITLSRAAEILGISVSKMREEVEEWSILDDR